MEKSVGMFKRAAGGWVEYRQCPSEEDTLCFVREIEESNCLEDNRATIRILYETSYHNKEIGKSLLVLYFIDKRRRPLIAASLGLPLSTWIPS